MSWQAKVGNKLRELRFVYCQISQHSEGLRNFVNKNYSSVKENHPRFPFIVRECENAIPTVMARYDFGVEKRVYTENFTEEQVADAVKQLVDEADSINSHRPTN